VLHVLGRGLLAPYCGVSAGEAHTLVVSGGRRTGGGSTEHEGGVLAFGSDDFGQLGLWTSTEPLHLDEQAWQQLVRRGCP
jgi:hypothetical protein